MEHICSDCGNVVMKRSSIHGKLDKLWATLGFYPWRCHRCTRRERLRDAGPREPMGRKRADSPDMQQS